MNKQQGDQGGDGGDKQPIVEIDINHAPSGEYPGEVEVEDVQRVEEALIDIYTETSHLQWQRTGRQGHKRVSASLIVVKDDEAVARSYYTKVLGMK